MSVFMPDSRIRALIDASQPARPAPPAVVTRYPKGLTISGTSAAYGNIDVTGNLTISGSGTYTFGWVSVSGSVLIKNASAVVSMDSLRVGGALTVSAGRFEKLGSAYVAGSTGLTGSGQWNMGLLVTGGSVTIGGTQTVGSVANPVTILMTGASKTALTYGSAGTFCGLLCNRYGNFVQNSGKIVGSVQCNTTATMKNGSSIDYDPVVAGKVLGVLPPATTALVNGSPLPAAPWYGTSPVTISLTSIANDWATVARIYYTIDGMPGVYAGPFSVPATSGSPDGTYTVQYWAQDSIGNVEAAKTVAINIDTAAPTLAPSKDPVAEWTNGSVVVSANATDATSGIDEVTWSYTKNGAPRESGSGDSLQLTDEGVYAVTFTATDRAGKSTSAGITVQIDATKPTVSVDVKPIVPPTSPDELPTTSYNRPVVDFSARDDGGSGLVPDQTSVTLDGNDIAVASGNALSEPLSEGAHTLTITAADNAGNVATSSYRFLVAAPLFTVQYEHPSEGDVIGLYAAETGATGAIWSGKTWHWTVREDDFEPVSFDGPVGFVTLDTEASYYIHLAVTHDVTGAMCVTDRTITAQAEPPRVNALDVEVLDGQAAKLVGRFLDPGWEQTHTAVWTVGGAEIPGVVSEDNWAAMDSGHVSGVTPELHTGDSPLQCYLTVTDHPTGQSTKVPFTITVRSDNPDADEQNGGNDKITASTPKLLSGGLAHLSYIQSADDVDIFEVTLPDGSSLPYGTEVLTTLRDLPADHDMAVIEDYGQDAEVGGAFGGSSFTSARIRAIPYDDARIRAIPVDDARIRAIPYEDSRIRAIPYEDTRIRAIPVDDARIRAIPFYDARIRAIPVDDARIRAIPVDDARIRAIPWDEVRIRAIPFVDARIRAIPYRGRQNPRHSLRARPALHHALHASRCVGRRAGRLLVLRHELHRSWHRQIE